MIVEKMKEHQIKKLMVTNITFWRDRLITKERMENYYKGKERETRSVNDDLEVLFEDIRLGKETDDQVHTYFLPRLTVNELILVERKDKHFMVTFSLLMNADVSKAEMAASKSDSKYINANGRRRTFTIKCPS